jgi:hypothetical protein
MKKIIVVLLMFIALSAKAQWQQAGGFGGYFGGFASYNNNIYLATYIMVENKDIPLYGPGIIYSTNNGTDWLQTAFIYPSRDIHFKGTRLFVYSNTEYKSYYSDNFGANWTQMNSYLNASYYSNNTYLFASTSPNGLLASTDDGINWTTIHSTNRPVFVKDNYIYQYGSDIYLSSNNGVNWTTINYNVSCMASNGVELYAGTPGGGVLKSTDNGYTFTPTTSFISNGISSIVAVGSNIISASNSSSGIFVSTNKGITWTQKNDGFTGSISISKLLYLNGFVYAGFLYTVWRRNFQNLVSINEISSIVPDKYSLSQNYPNPFNPTTKIKFDVAKAGEVKIIVFDVTGREVQTLVNESLKPGTYETSFDGSALNSGVYFYKITVGDFSQTKKMILLK